MSLELPPTRITDPRCLEGLHAVLETYYEQDPVPMEKVEAVVKRAESSRHSHADLPPTAQHPASISSLAAAPPASSSFSSSSQQCSSGSTEGAAPRKPWKKEVYGLRETAGEVRSDGEGGRDDAGGREKLQEELPTQAVKVEEDELGEAEPVQTSRTADEEAMNMLREAMACLPEVPVDANYGDLRGMDDDALIGMAFEKMDEIIKG
ncbi:hypothetical protein JCM8547_005361 [Rhodosporidiobolus lusitaniae]